MPTSPQFLQIANLLFKRVQGALKMKLIRDHYFNMGLSVQVKQHRLEVVPGFTTSIAKYEGGNLLGVDIIHKILRMDTVLDSLYNLYNSMNSSDVSAFHNQAIKNFVGNIVMTRFNNKTYRVDDIDWDARPTDTFVRKGENITYADYYKQHWNVTINDMDQPLLLTKPTDKDVRRGDKENLYLVPELCTITGLSEQARSDFNVMRDLAVHTRIGPDKRVATLEKFLNQINKDQEAQKVLRPWQMSIASNAARIPARQFPAEKLLMRDKQNQRVIEISYNIKEADWSRNMRNVHLLNPVHMQNWMIVFPGRAQANAAELSECLSRVGPGMGMNIGRPTVVELPNDRNDTYLQAIRHNLSEKVQMVVAVVLNNKKDRYDAIKKNCCIDNPVPSQVVMTKTLSKKQGLMSVATKIAIQMNCKMGGETWGSTIPMSNFMVVGMDSYHDSSNKNQSVGALVASLNKECTRYFSKTEYHPSKDDLMRNLTVLFSGALRKYHDVNGSLPQKIFIYRDGVGDGQLPVVYHSEMDQIRQACRDSAGDAYKPQIAFIVVKKRINTRLFSQEGNQIINPQPGTVVDDFVTKSEWYDFFIVSQSVRQGTVTPTSFNVIFDETGLHPDHVQRLTYKMTHLYFNWQKSDDAGCKSVFSAALKYVKIIEQDPPQRSEPSTSSAGQKRIAKMFNVSDAQILLDNIPTDYSTCTDEEPDSDPDDPDFTPDPLPSLANVDRLSLAAAAVDEGASSNEEERRIRPDVTHQWRKRPLDKQEREFSKHVSIVCMKNCHLGPV
ncbi:piwi-like protein 1 [Plakobranchus ocellatus]|uniref:Piwi-like protein 1 n=1 Tax=Plakobranchus ocellatus TaxID=259542 RepID=A0AAV4DJ02_9GAST|nr:piwi-like protein 1 [Plakobranchus ocellatus]